MAYKDPYDERAREARRRHYQKNKQQYFDRRNQQRNDMREYINTLKSVPCMDCKVSYPAFVMDFDHRDPKEKVAEIGVMIQRGSWSKLKLEIAKCDIVCANCHRIRTWTPSAQTVA